MTRRMKSEARSGGERRWWGKHPDEFEPLMGVPSAVVAGVPEPLPDIASDEPEPGVEPEQEADAEFGFAFDTPGEP